MPRCCVLSLAIVAICLLPVPVEAELLDVPSATAIKSAQVTVNRVFRDDLTAAKTPFLKNALAEKLLRTAGETIGDPAGRYVLYQLASELAAKGGKIEVALESLTQCAKFFKIKELEQQVALVTKSAHLIREPESLIHVSKLAGSALKAERYELATKVIDIAIKSARRMKDRTRLAEYLAQRTTIKKSRLAWNAAEKAAVVLVNNPNDQAAAVALCRYLCLHRDNWKDGLVLLKRSPDASLTAIVDMEFKRDKTPKDFVALGDAWWEWAAKDKRKRAEFLTSSRFWYQKSLPDIFGLDRKQVESRLQELEGLEFERRNLATPAMVNPDIPPEPAPIQKQN